MAEIGKGKNSASVIDGHCVFSYNSWKATHNYIILQFIERHAN